MKAASPRPGLDSFFPLPSFLPCHAPLPLELQDFLFPFSFLRLATGLVKADTLWRIFIYLILRLSIPLSRNDKPARIDSRASLIGRRRHQQETSFIPSSTFQSSHLGPALPFVIASVTVDKIYHIPFHSHSHGVVQPTPRYHCWIRSKYFALEEVCIHDFHIGSYVLAQPASVVFSFWSLVAKKDPQGNYRQCNITRPVSCQQQ